MAEQGQFTDRFTRAVDQLDRTGPEHLQARLGGIYALERLARDSPRDQPVVIEVLAAFIRTTSPASGSDTSTPASLDADIQAALSVLGRRAHAHDNNTTIELADADLRAAALDGANLVGVDLDGAQLHAASLFRCDLSHA